MFLTLFSIISAILLILTLVIIHEAGHFFVARFFGMQTPVVGLGLPFFGPTWILGKFKNVEFRFHPLLLGAYVAIPEMDDESIDEDFNIKLEEPKRVFPAWQRMLVSFAGPIANIIFAFILSLCLICFVGVPQTSKGQVFLTGIRPSASLEVKQKLKREDILIRIDNKKVSNTANFIEILRSFEPETTVKLDIQRQTLLHNIKTNICKEELVKTDKNGFFNIELADLSMNVLGQNGVEYQKVTGFPVIAHIREAWIYFSELFSYMWSSFIFLITAPFQKLANGPKIEDFHGIINITGKIAEFLKQDYVSAFKWGILISIDLGILNLLPILPLDGGHILFQACEMIFKPEQLTKIKPYVAQTGLFLILMLTCVILFNDLRDLILRPH